MINSRKYSEVFRASIMMPLLAGTRQKECFLQSGNGARVPLAYLKKQEAISSPSIERQGLSLKPFLSSLTP